jgi:hypothetical protein
MPFGGPNAPSRAQGMIELERRSLRARGLPPQGQRIEISLPKLPAEGH